MMPVNYGLPSPRGTSVFCPHESIEENRLGIGLPGDSLQVIGRFKVEETITGAGYNPRYTGAYDYLKTLKNIIGNLKTACVFSELLREF